MKYTPDGIDALFALFEGAGLRQPPQLATDAGYDTAVRVWCIALDGIPLAAVHGAFALHLRTPERGRFWPVPADLIGHIPQAHAVAVLPAMDPDEQAWERILAVLRKGPHAPEAQASVEFRERTEVEETRAASGEVLARREVTRTERVWSPSPLERSLTPAQQAALVQIGRLGGIRRAEANGDAAIVRASLRKRFLALCRAPAATGLEAPPARPEIPEGAPAYLRLAFTADDEHGTERTAHLERARRA